MIRLFGFLSALALLALPLLRGSSATPGNAEAFREVVVTLASPPLAGRDTAAHRIAIERQQARFASDLHAAIPEATIHWRYRLVLNGAAVVVPQRALSRLSQLTNVKAVDTGASYSVAAVTAADVERTTRRWQAGLPNRGDGVKIGIIDDGVDQRHPYFSPAGYAMPTGYPKGQTEYTTAKVIVARAFAPASTTWRNARLPFDPEQSEHATHVAGIAAGNAGTIANGTSISGVAPRAYIGNYNALSVPTDADVGLDGNAAELVAAIESAVADGMDVINLSLGEPEVEPTRDLVALALDGAARAGVIPVVAAGNDFDEFGKGSVSSPGSSNLAITVAAVTVPDAKGNSTLADFSSSGPTPLSLRMKPDVSAPGVSILSSLPKGLYSSWSGTSMASPQVAGAAALLRERHPTWPVSTLKAALIGSGDTVRVGGQPAPPTRGGGGLVNPARADVPLILARPASLSFGLLSPGVSAPVQLDLTDAEGGAGVGVWDVAVETMSAVVGAKLTVPATASVPGALTVTANLDSVAVDGDFSGFILLTRGADVRRVPFWLHVSRPALAAATSTSLTTQRLVSGNTKGKPSRVSRYRYPEVPVDGPVSAVLLGPEQVFRFTLTRPVANFGVAITRRGSGVRVEPRVVSAGDENRLTGYAALPLHLNPYLAQFGEPVLVAGALRPQPGRYDIVFDSATTAGAGAYTFRFWVDDTRPPSATLVQARLRRSAPVFVRVSDAGSGVDPGTAVATIDGKAQSRIWKNGTLRISTRGIFPGTHELRLQISDYQESRNTENVPPILPNTRVLKATIVIR
ncbi:MAG: S8 family serine peptidase [Thermoleophilia bacterium]|nr:S8 family serine peptidase [Thermoleophilia bacterium]